MTRTVGHAFDTVYGGIRFDTFLLDDAPVWVACEIGHLLDYADRGSRLCTLVRTDWRDDFAEGTEFHVLAGVRLAAFKEVFPPDFEGVDRRASKLLVLTRSGLERVLLKSDKPERVPLRKFIERNVFLRLALDAATIAGPATGAEPPRVTDPVAVLPTRDARLADELLLKRCIFRSSFLRDTIRVLHALGMTDDTARAAYEVRAAEIALDEELPDLRPVANERWFTANSIARETGMSPAVVSRVISALGIRGAPGLSREVVTVTSDDEKTVRSFVYNARARDLILAACGATPPERAA
ncbi:MAG: hypothetical protein Q8P18_28135 [Pseudomonadota bacterium]|nr:hypothetical protein [Pseudomonadota bacterium]